MSQLSIFDCFDTGTKPLRIGDKKIRVIENFSGIGAQLKAFEMLERDGYLPNGFESWKTSDWEYNAVLSYQAIHRPDDKTDYSLGKTKEQIASELYFLGISSDGKTPLTLQQIQKIPEKKIRPIYNAFRSTNNIGSITGVHAKDLEIVEKDKYTYVFTYSSPCTDLSNAGKQAGLGKGTRSGLLWEIERILTECVSAYSESEWAEHLPDLLMLENVPPLVGKFKSGFDDWCRFLESLGYHNAWQILNATDYGIPQNRERVFMWSWLGDFHYKFPEPFELDIRLKDCLDPWEVDEKYYLSEKAVEGLTAQLDFSIPPLS